MSLEHSGHAQAIPTAATEIRRKCIPMDIKGPPGDLVSQAMSQHGLGARRAQLLLNQSRDRLRVQHAGVCGCVRVEEKHQGKIRPAQFAGNARNERSPA